MTAAVELRERAILAAVIELLGEVGYEAMTMDAVAARAHASKTTIYRRWPGKPELVRSAVDSRITGGLLAAPDTGTLWTTTRWRRKSSAARWRAGSCPPARRWPWRA